MYADLHRSKFYLAQTWTAKRYNLGTVRFSNHWSRQRSFKIWMNRCIDFDVNCESYSSVLLRVWSYSWAFVWRGAYSPAYGLASAAGVNVLLERACGCPYITATTPPGVKTCVADIRVSKEMKKYTHKAVHLLTLRWYRTLCSRHVRWSEVYSFKNVSMNLTHWFD